ncbi:MAG: hypothetical protein IJM96_04295 [Clostridia bacterium]|nr:hypothetical protein [Clostridia bacterium]
MRENKPVILDANANDREIAESINLEKNAELMKMSLLSSRRQVMTSHTKWYSSTDI